MTTEIDTSDVICCKCLRPCKRPSGFLGDHVICWKCRHQSVQLPTKKEYSERIENHDSLSQRETLKSDKDIKFQNKHKPEIMKHKLPTTEIDETLTDKTVDWEREAEKQKTTNAGQQNECVCSKCGKMCKRPTGYKGNAVVCYGCRQIK